MKEYDVSSANTYLKGNLQKSGPISDTVMKGMKYYLGNVTMISHKITILYLKK